MNSITLNLNQPADGEAVDTALANYGPLPDNVLLVVRHLQAEIDALAARVATLAG